MLKKHSQKPAQSKAAKHLWPAGVAGFATLLVLGVVYFNAGLLGGNTLAAGQLYTSLLPNIATTREILFGSEGLYTLTTAGGVSFWPQLMSTLASPLNWPLLFVPTAGVLQAANLVLALKLAVGGACAALFFYSGANPVRLGPVNAAAFGIMYALGGYSLLGLIQPAAPDFLWLFPLVMLGLLSIGYRFGPVLLCTALSLMLMLDFWLALTVLAVLAVCCAVWLLFCATRHEGAVFAARALLCTVAAGLISAVVWLPLQMQSVASADAGSDLYSEFYATGFFETLADTLPVLFCTAPIFAAILTLAAKKGFATRDSRVLLALFCFASAALFVRPVAVLWQGEAYPATGFIPLLLGLMLAALCIKHLAAQKQAKTGTMGGNILIGLCYALYVGGVFLALFIGRGGFGQLAPVVLCCAVGVVVLCILFAAWGRKKLTRGSAAAVLLCFAVVQGIFTSTLFIGGSTYRTSGYDAGQDLAAAMQQDVRVKLSRQYIDANQLGAISGGSIATSSAFTRADYLAAYKMLGYSGYGMQLSGHGGTVLSDYFLNIGYVITRPGEGEQMENVGKALYANETYALQAQHTGGYAVVSPAAADALTKIPGSDRFDAQIWLWQKVYGMQESPLQIYAPDETPGVEYELYDALDRYGVWQQQTGTVGELVYNFYVGERETLYFDCFRYVSSLEDEIVNDGLAVKVNGEYVETLYPTRTANGILCLGSFANETVQVTIEVLRDELVRSFGVYGIKDSDMQTLAAQANHAEVSRSGSTFTVQAEASATSTLVLAIAYDEGFTATVNGEKVEVYKVLDGFVGITLPPGQSTIVLRFAPRGLWAGMVLCLLGLLMLAALVLWAQRRKGEGKTYSDTQLAAARVCRTVLIALGAVCALLLLLLPLVLYLDRGQI